MQKKSLPFLFAGIVFLPVALFLVIIVLLGRKLELIVEKDVTIIALAAAVIFLAAVIYFQRFFKKKGIG